MKVYYIFIIYSYLIQLFKCLRINLKPTLVHYYDTYYTLSNLFDSSYMTIPTIELCFGTPNNQCFNFVIDINYGKSVIIDKSTQDCSNITTFDRLLSSTYKEINKEKDDFFFYRYKGYDSEDIVNFKEETNIPHTTFSFMLIDTFSISNQSFNHFDGILSLNERYLSHNDEEKIIPVDFSFLNYLMKTEKITQMNYVLHTYSDGNGYIIFGENETNINEYRTSDTASQTYWILNLDEASIGNQTFSIFPLSINVFFNLLSPYIEVNENAGGNMIRDYIIEISKGKCYSTLNASYTFIICDPTIKVDEFPDIKIKFQGNNEIVLQWKYLFKLMPINESGIEVQKYVSLLTIDNFRYHNWFIGSPGFIGRSILFDFSNNKIGFKPLIKIVKHQRNDFIKVIFAIITVLLSLGIAYYFLLTSQTKKLLIFIH